MWLAKLERAAHYLSQRSHRAGLEVESLKTDSRASLREDSGEGVGPSRGHFKKLPRCRMQGSHGVVVLNQSAGSCGKCRCLDRP